MPLMVLVDEPQVHRWSTLRDLQVESDLGDPCAVGRTGEDFCVRVDRTTVRGWSRDRELSDGALCSLR